MVRSSTFTAINQIKMKIVAYNYYNATVANNYKYFTLIVSNTCIKVQRFTPNFKTLNWVVYYARRRTNKLTASGLVQSFNANMHAKSLNRFVSGSAFISWK